METIEIFGLVAATAAVVILGLIYKMRNMPQYKISKEEDDKWYVKLRKGLSYYYLEQTHDAPGYVNDIFELSKHKTTGHDTYKLAEKIAHNHRITTVNGIEVEGE